MHPKRIAIVAAVLAILCAACAAVAVAVSGGWGDSVTEWHYRTDGAHTLMVWERQIGTTNDTINDTRFVRFTDLLGNAQAEHVSQYMTLDLSPYIPSDAKVVQIAVKTIITKSTNTGTADVFAFVRAPGSTCCVGPVESPTTPVDFSVSTNPDHLGVAAQSVLGDLGGIRDFVNDTIPVVNGKIEVSWGYQRQPGDALAIDIYLDGYGT